LDLPAELLSLLLVTGAGRVGAPTVPTLVAIGGHACRQLAGLIRRQMSMVQAVPRALAASFFN
jgi:hypothetical protein